jgi:hypothetical protein
MSKSYRKFDKQTADKIRNLKRRGNDNYHPDDYESYKSRSDRQQSREYVRGDDFDY